MRKEKFLNLMYKEDYKNKGFYQILSFILKIF